MDPDTVFLVNRLRPILANYNEEMGPCLGVSGERLFHRVGVKPQMDRRKNRQTDGWMDRRQTKATNTIKYIQISISEEGSIDTHGKSHGTNWSFAQL